MRERFQYILYMLRTVSPALRVGRALTALITVWCLGCSGFEPIVDSLLGLGAAPGMVCASEMDATGTMSAMDSAEVPLHATVSAPSDGHRRFDCGCAQSCQSASPTRASSLPHVDPALRVAAANLPQPPSVVRVPLLPPPQRLTA
jgi:hypothetical protein